MLQPFKHHLPTNFTFISLFIMTLIFFQIKWLTLTLFILFCLLLIVAFLKEKQRIFVWITIAYFVGELIYLYGNRLLYELPYHVNSLLILDKLLLLFPIGFIFYVCSKFKQNLITYFKKTVWNEKISFPFFHKTQYSVAIRNFLLIAIIISFSSFLPFILNEKPVLSVLYVIYVLLFALVSSILEEVLWRGLLLSAMLNFSNERLAVVFSSIAFGLSYLMFGYSLSIYLLLALFGFIFAHITIQSGSLFPAFILHFSFNILLIFSGMIRMVPL